MLRNECTRDFSVTMPGVGVVPYQVGRPKQKIACQGEASTYCYLVIQGVLTRSISAPSGKRQIIGFHLAGDVCGNVAAVAPTLDYSIEALSEVTFVRILTRSLPDLIEDQRLLMRHHSVDAAISRQWLFNVGQRPAYQRLAHLICEIEARMREVGLSDDGAFRWHGTQSDIGAALGLSLVHVNKTLGRLDHDDLVRWRGGVVKIADVPHLRKIAGFDPAYLGLHQENLGGVLSSSIGTRQDAPRRVGSVSRFEEMRQGTDGHAIDVDRNQTISA